MKRYTVQMNVVVELNDDELDHMAELDDLDTGDEDAIRAALEGQLGGFLANEVNNTVEMPGHVVAYTADVTDMTEEVDA